MNWMYCQVCQDWRWTYQARVSFGSFHFRCQCCGSRVVSAQTRAAHEFAQRAKMTPPASNKNVWIGLSVIFALTVLPIILHGLF